MHTDIGSIEDTCNDERETANEQRAEKNREQCREGCNHVWYLSDCVPHCRTATG